MVGASMDKNYYELSIKELEILAKQDDVEAAYFVGMVHLKQGNIERAIQYLGNCYRAKHAKGTYQLALIHFNRKEYDKAEELFEGALNFGDKRAYFYLGQLYEHGYGVKKNLHSAYNFYTFAIAQGNEEAKAYRDVLKLPPDDEEQDDYDIMYKDELEILFANKDYKACFALGKKYEKEGNSLKAFKTFEKGADIGDVDCINKMGLYYFNGTVGETNYKNAFAYFSYAARRGKVDAMYNLAYCFEKGFGVEENITMAIYWYQTAADLGDEDARGKLNELKKKYPEGEMPDPTEPIEVKELIEVLEDDEILSEEEELRLKALNGDFMALRDLFDIYLKNKDYEKAYETTSNIYEEMEDDIYAFFLGLLYYHGHYVEQDYDKAFEYFLKASGRQVKYRYGGPAFYLYRCYKNGYHVEANPKLAFSFLKRAANYNFIGSYLFMAEAYEKGEGTKANLEEAITWYKKAAEEGNEKAIQRLKELGIN